MRNAVGAVGFCVVLAFVASLAGCGVYSASSGRVDESLKRVFVQYLENLTPEPDIGVAIADEIVAALQQDNTLKIVGEEQADSVISGKVVRYSLREVAAKRDLTVNEYQVQIAVTLTFTVQADNSTIFKNRRFTGTGNYALDDPNGQTEEDARAEAAAEIVRDILAQVVEDW